MALDKQKILSELGSVMSQLQSADCGCMGKLFGNTTSPAPNMGNPAASGGFNHGCGHCHGHNHFHGSCNGEPCPPTPVQHMNQTCMGRCNPAKLYADTYQHLNNNLMQPVVQEVYNDLKSITPANTVMNNQTFNPLNSTQGHTNMQLMQNQKGITSENVSRPYHNQGNLDQRMINMSGTRDQLSGGGGISGAGAKSNMNVLGANVGSAGGFMSGVEGYMSGAGREYINGPGHHVGRIGEQVSGVGGHMAGMGPNIVNMMMSGHKSNANEKPLQGGGTLTQPMVIDAPHSPHGQIGVTPIPAQMGTHQSSDSPIQALNQLQNENNKGNFNKPNLNSSYVSNAAKPVQQITPNHCAHGQHAHGIAKFNEMFPGVMAGFGGDLNFDPMAIAVQMNPANQQRTAIDTMQKLMCGNNSGINGIVHPQNTGQPLNENTATDARMAQSNINQNQLQPSNGPVNTLNNSRPPISEYEDINQQFQNHEEINNTNDNEQHQKVYTNTDQQLLKQQVQGKNQQLLIDPNSSGEVMNTPNPQTQHSIPDTRSLSEPAPWSEKPQMEKEPIFPANVSKNQSYSHTKRPANYTYNTLGQPIEMLPAHGYHIKDPGGPQTLSPQNLPSKPIHDPRAFSNVKSTVSRTSIIGNRPVGRNPSKSQLQHIYNQYKGSQSLTQQNILNRTEGGTHSEGMLNVPQQRAGRNVHNQQIVVEKVGGDTLPENEANYEAAKRQVVSDQIGDVQNVEKVQNNAMREQSIPIRNSKARNGLQDIVYTSYPASAAWSFHGHARPSYSVGPRNRTRF